MTSLLPGLYRLSVSARIELAAEAAGLATSDLEALRTGGLTPDDAATMVENAVGVFGVPLGVCANLLVDGVERLAPMAIEEPSVVAAASHAAKLLRSGGGIRTEVSPSIMIGQVQLLDIPHVEEAARFVDAVAEELIHAAGRAFASLHAHGGGVRRICARPLFADEPDDPVGPMLIVHIHVDVQEAMGANVVNAVCEWMAPRLEACTGGRARLRILSNLSDRRRVSARATVRVSELGFADDARNRDVARGIVEASVFAERDPYRAATHNKGIMNGVDAVLLATGQDVRAVEASAHAFAADGGRYRSLSRWRVHDDVLEGTLEMPMAVGVVGGITRRHPAVALCLRLARIRCASELSALAAAVGLAQNLGALRALASEGISRGHMRMHARNVAADAGAVGQEIFEVAERIAHAGNIHLDAARKALAELRAGRPR